MATIFHPGTITLITWAALFPALHRHRALSLLKGAVDVTKSRIAKVALSFVLLTTAASIAQKTGMLSAIAQCLSLIMGYAYTALIPLVGMIGTYLTGSNTASNIIFGPLQLSYARAIASESLVLLAAQNAGGALGSPVSLAKIVAGTHAVEAEGKEGVILRKSIPFVLISCLILGAITKVIASIVRS